MAQTRGLFDDEADETLGGGRGRQRLGEHAWVLRGFALPDIEALLAGVKAVLLAAPLRQMHTPGGLPMSVSTSNCGRLGWVSDRAGYRYVARDPLTGRDWPALPAAFERLAREAAAAAGFDGFVPDACLINRYMPGARMSLHQDRNERDMGAPIVSVSLGMPAIFLFGGHARADRATRIPLLHGDVAVWGGVDRLRFHGILPLKAVPHPRVGERRFNLTFRRAG
ncbi:DNA oxidative demethylase AlkB [Chitinasiproducens palmae]|uniref:DNA-N1-methyladenine dioxygenase n=1 Tax=Chitinasiproducens palmae TaxID=1770053 RepID=A0A1H2PTW1_9BURK|nr:DNA oxidative demethylase AlkB [Chitinasiproducens palmae]SDV50582.1 DNA-N1-methyladenine dioxygenase [Chitinasiproducens palmae]